MNSYGINKCVCSHRTESNHTVLKYCLDIYWNFKGKFVHGRDSITIYKNDKKKKLKNSTRHFIIIHQIQVIGKGLLEELSFER